MARALRIQFPGAHYHITCRGIERRDIYMDRTDRGKFLALLAESLDTYQVTLFAYVMMDNHFHFLIQTRKANCSEFMRHFNIRYTGWFNWRHERGGNLYQGRYHAYLVDADDYLLEVSRYVHLNPVRVKQLQSATPQERLRRSLRHSWSSLPGYLDARYAQDFVDYERVLARAGGRRAYRTFVMDGLKLGLENPFKRVLDRLVLGDKEFESSVKRHLRRVAPREQPSYREMISVALAPEAVLGVLRREFNISNEMLARRGVNGLIRGIVAELLYKYCDLTQDRIGQILGGIDYVAVSLLRKRLRKRMEQDDEARRRYAAFEARIKVPG